MGLKSQKFKPKGPKPLPKTFMPVVQYFVTIQIPGVLELHFKI